MTRAEEYHIYSQLEPEDKIIVGREKKRNAGWYQILTTPIEVPLNTEDDYEHLTDDDL